MQDRFKFRAWDRSKKIMHINDFVVTSTGYIANLNELYEIEYDNEIDEEKQIKSENQFMIDNSDYDFGKDLILLQCTGLKDKNGKLIYEGDIVILYSEIPCKAIVEWETDGYCVTYIDAIYKNNGSALQDWELQHIEVIGNIYENPELLYRRTGTIFKENNKK